MDQISIPRCDEAKDFMRRMVSGEARGALAYIVPLSDTNSEIQVPTYDRDQWAEVDYDAERLLELRLALLTKRRWGTITACP